MHRCYQNMQPSCNLLRVLVPKRRVGGRVDEASEIAGPPGVSNENLWLTVNYVEAKALMRLIRSSPPLAPVPDCIRGSHYLHCCPTGDTSSSMHRTNHDLPGTKLEVCSTWPGQCFPYHSMARGSSAAASKFSPRRLRRMLC